jgi:hypothetical protein
VTTGALSLPAALPGNKAAASATVPSAPMKPDLFMPNMPLASRRSRERRVLIQMT